MCSDPETALPAAILDHVPVDVLFEIPDFGDGVVSYVTVSLYGTHTYPDDVTITLKHPDATEVVLFSYFDDSITDFGESETERLTFVWDAAATPIYLAAQDEFGPFRPEGNLGVMAGRPIAGTWTLTVADTAGGDEGELVVATLCVFDSTIAAPEPPDVPAVDFAAGAPDAEGFVDFDGTVTGGAPPITTLYTFDGNMDGGGDRTALDTFHGFAAAGTYGVVLEATDTERLTGTATHPVVIASITPRDFAAAGGGAGVMFLTDGRRVVRVDPMLSHRGGEFTVIVPGDGGATKSYQSVSAKPDGTKVAYTEIIGATRAAYVCDADGSNVTLILAGGAQWVAWSPDGSKLLVSNGSVSSTLSYWDFGTSTLVPILVSVGEILRITTQPWSPDSSKVVYCRGSAGNGPLRIVGANGAGDHELRALGADAAWRSDDVITFSGGLAINPDGSGETTVLPGWPAIAMLWSPNAAYAYGFHGVWRQSPLRKYLMIDPADPGLDPGAGPLGGAHNLPRGTWV